MSANIATETLFNNLWVLICGVLVFIMTIAVGILNEENWDDPQIGLC